MRNAKYFVLVGSISGLVAVTALNGCSSPSDKEAKETGRTQGQVADDRRINSNVSNSLKTAPIYKYPDVGVKTYNGVVQLNGFVTTDDQKRTAGEIAQRTPGVAKVVNGLMVQPPPMAPTGRMSQPTNGPSAPIITPEQ
jgi:hyperosmotically inducible protein